MTNEGQPLHDTLNVGRAKNSVDPQFSSKFPC